MTEADTRKGFESVWLMCPGRSLASLISVKLDFNQILRENNSQTLETFSAHSYRRTVMLLCGPGQMNVRVILGTRGPKGIMLWHIPFGIIVTIQVAINRKNGTSITPFFSHLLVCLEVSLIWNIISIFFAHQTWRHLWKCSKG